MNITTNSHRLDTYNFIFFFRQLPETFLADNSATYPVIPTKMMRLSAKRNLRKCNAVAQTDYLFYIKQNTTRMEQEQQFDVIIVGGSYAGLSAALILGRSLRKVLVIDSGKPCNRQTPHSHSFLTRDGETPAQIAAVAREQLLKYPTVSFLADRVIDAEKTLDGFVVRTITDQQFDAKKLILATGVEDSMPAIPGFAACWGISVLHCPYCHGYEVHGQQLGIIANGDTAYEMAWHIQHWSPNMTLFTNGPATISDEHRQIIAALNIPIIEKEIAAIEHQHGQLKTLRFTDGTDHVLDAVFSRVAFRQHSDLAQRLGCKIDEPGYISVSAFGETSIPGVYAAGDNSSPMRQVLVAATKGNLAGVMINRTLIEEKIAALSAQTAN